MSPNLTKERKALHMWLAAFAYLGICLVIQWRTNAGAAAFGTYPDEPAHYVGGLLVRDYMVSGFLKSPISFAQNYYEFRPYFGVGYWPPLFYCVEGVWMLLFGPARPLVLLLSALFAAGAALLILYVIEREAGYLAGFCGGLLFLALPEVQRQICTVMVDLPVTVGILAATIFASRYLTSESWTDSIGFALCAAAACLTKYSAAYVCAVPFLAIIMLRRWTLLRRLNFWIQPAIIIGVVLPWIFLSARFARRLVQLDFVGLSEERHYPMLERLALFLKAASHTITWPAWILVVAGLTLWIFRRSHWGPVRVTFLIHFAALLVFLTASSVMNEPRYFTPGAAALLIAGLSSSEWARRFPRPWTAGVFVACTVMTFAIATRVDPELKANDIRPVVDRVIRDARWNQAAVFVSTEAEGAMIAEFAMREGGRPGYRLVRPGKVLAKDNWFGGNYRPLWDTPEQVQNVLSDLHVRVVILKSHADSERKPHDVLLRQAVTERSDLWQSIGVVPGSHYEIFAAL
jgi:hypothetical protein